MTKLIDRILMGLLIIVYSCNTGQTTETKVTVDTLTYQIEPIPKSFLYPISIKGKWGYIDSLGKIIVDPIYSSANDFENGTGAMFPNRAYVIIINGKGQVISKSLSVNGNNFNYLDYNSENLILVDTLAKFGYKNINGKWVIKPQFEDARFFKNGLAAVVKNLNIHPDTNSGCGTPVRHSKWGFINTKGEYVISPQYGFVSDFFNGYALADNKIIDTNGKDISIENVKDKRFLYYRFQFIDSLVYGNEKRWIPENPEDFTNGYIVYQDKQSNKYGYLDWNGKVVIKPQYNNPTIFSEDVCGVSLDNGKWGVIDTNGKMIIQPRFDFIFHFSEGLAAVKVKNKYGFINKKGDLVIQPIFDERETLPTSYYFYGGLARVYIKEKMCYVNRIGKIVWAEP